MCFPVLMADSDEEIILFPSLFCFLSFGYINIKVSQECTPSPLPPPSRACWYYLDVQSVLLMQLKS